MKEERLLERIARMEQGGARSHVTRAELLVNSIIEHLRRILNTRQGSVPIDEAFGVPEFTHIASAFRGEMVNQLIDNITTMIRRYEPRLKRPRINALANEHDLLSVT